MTDKLAHRGPDDSGIWEDTKAGVVIGHRRLAVIDLSSKAHQPMLSACGRYVIAFNGEVYNFKELRTELESKGQLFRGNSDTEVVVAAVSEWGVRNAVRRFVGMFAFALWDRKERKLCLVRDRVGIKPLYYGWVADSFVFGSELKSIRRHPKFDNSIDRRSLCAYFRHSYVPAPYSIYEKMRKVEPGSILELRWHAQESDTHPDPEISSYWSAKAIWQQGARQPFEGTEAEAVNELECILQEAVGTRMVADVPLGAFLSGGIDSATVVALMQAQSDRPIRTFSIGFHEEGYDEAPYARKVAEHLKTDHTELYVSAKQAFEVIPRIPRIWDEPFADSSQIPTCLLSELTRRYVTVSLSGDGGDELWAGYRRYATAKRYWEFTRKFPSPLLNMLGWARHVPDCLFALLGDVGEKLKGRGEVINTSDFRLFYRYFVSHHKSPTQLVKGGEEPVTHFTDGSFPQDVTDVLDQMTFLDLVSYLPDDILTKVDRASMAVSLEARVPMLDHRIVELAARIPSRMKVVSGVSKSPLRQVLYRYVPRYLVDHQKKGFAPPMGRWLKRELRDWAEDLLDEHRIQQQGFLHPKKVRKTWNSYLAGAPWRGHLWDILMFQAWLSSEK